MRKLLPVLLMVPGILFSACEKEPEEFPAGTTREDWTEQVDIAMPDGKEITDRVHGKEVWFAIAPIHAVSEEPANGVTQAHFFEDGTYLHNLKVNVARNEEGFFYEGWVARSGDPSEWVSLGHLSSHFGDARHGVQFREKQDLRGYLQVKVTRERDDGDPSPGLLLAEGTLKVTERP